MIDRSGHQAGYNWAAQNGITNADDCSGESQSFIEGCMAYAGENLCHSYNSDPFEDQNNDHDNGY